MELTECEQSVNPRLMKRFEIGKPFNCAQTPQGNGVGVGVGVAVGVMVGVGVTVGVGVIVGVDVMVGVGVIVGVGVVVALFVRVGDAEGVNVGNVGDGVAVGAPGVVGVGVGGTQPSSATLTARMICVTSITPV